MFDAITHITDDNFFSFRKTAQWCTCIVHTTVQLMVACICHLVFSATTHYFFLNIVLWQVCHNTLFFGGMYLPPYFFSATTHYFFSKNIVLCAMSTTQYFFEKIMCCGKFVTTHYFLKIILCCRNFVTTHYLKK